MSLKSEDAPIKWYTFYSLKAGREYYYEPKSGVVTWILPDDLHPQPMVKPKEMMDRRVSFHESVNDPETPAPRSLLRKAGRNKPGKSRQIPIFAAIICLCVLLGTAICKGWLSRGMLGLEMSGNDASDAELSTTSAFAPQIDRSLEEEDIRHMKPQDENVQHDHDPERHGETFLKFRVTAPLGEEHDEDTASTEQGSEGINETRATTQTRDAKCLIPFAHAFSRKCRIMLDKRPVYDMDALLDFMI
jgi:hypothetical protein